MKSKFSEMPVGTEFELDDGDGEYGPLVAYKLNDHEAFMIGQGAVRSRRISTTRCCGEFVDVDSGYGLTGTVRDTHDTYTDLERVALTLADKHCCAVHPALSMWVAAVQNDPNEIRSLDEYAWDNRDAVVCDNVTRAYTLRQLCDERGFAFPAKRFDRDCHLFSLIWDGTPEGEYKHAQITTDYRRDNGEYDAPLLALCNAVIEYRERGRVSGEHSHDIGGLGSTLLVVTTSLAAAIVEYVERIRCLDLRHRNGRNHA